MMMTSIIAWVAANWIALAYLALALTVAGFAWRTRMRPYRLLAGLALLAWGLENLWVGIAGWDGAPPLIAASDLGLAVATTRVARQGAIRVCRIVVSLYALRFLVQVVAPWSRAPHYGFVFYLSLNLLYAAMLLALVGGSLVELARDRDAGRSGDLPWGPARGFALGALVRHPRANQGQDRAVAPD